jgi:hypothetical protein
MSFLWIYLSLSEVFTLDPTCGVLCFDKRTGSTAVSPRGPAEHHPFLSFLSWGQASKPPASLRSICFGLEREKTASPVGDVFHRFAVMIAMGKSHAWPVPSTEEGTSQLKINLPFLIPHPSVSPVSKVLLPFIFACASLLLSAFADPRSFGTSTRSHFMLLEGPSLLVPRLLFERKCTIYVRLLPTCSPSPA